MNEYLKKGIIFFMLVLVSTVLVGLSAMLPIELAVPLVILFAITAIGLGVLTIEAVGRWADDTL